MKKTKIMLLLTMLIVISSCASRESRGLISTSAYQKELEERCINNISLDKKEDLDERKSCIMSSYTVMHLGSGIYEKGMAEKDKAACMEKESEPSKVTYCFQQAQRAFYSNWVKNQKNTLMDAVK